MATPYFGWILPTVGADADAWGSLLNSVFTSQDTVFAAPANTIKGNNTGSTAAPINLTPSQVGVMLPAVAGATQSVAGTKGVVPQPAAGDQNRVLAGDGTFRANLGRAFGCVITTTNVNGSQPTFTNGLNVASLSTISVTGGLVACTVTLTNALPNATYAIHATTAGNPGTESVDTSYGTKTTTSFVLYWGTLGGIPFEISVSGFV
jgi:hypothetical protein